MQITLTTFDGEVINLPEALAIDDADLKFHEVPSMTIPNRHGRLVVGDRCRRDQRTVKLSGVVRDVDRATLDATLSDLNGKLCRGEMQLRRNVGDSRYLKVRTTGIQVNYNRGHYKGAVASLSCNLVADDPYWYGAEQTVERIVSGTPGTAVRVEAEAPGTCKVTLGSATRSTNSWSITSNYAAASGQRILSSNVPGDYLELSFYGSGISIIGFLISSGDQAIRNFDVYTDGVYKTQVKLGAGGLNRPATDTFAIVYSESGLAPGKHTIKAQISDNSSGYVHLDCFDILPSAVLEITNPGTADAEPDIYLEAVEQETSGDFLGKVAGSVAENKNKAFYNSGLTNITPAGSWFEYDNNYYGSISKKDGVPFGLSAGFGNEAGEYPQNRFSFNLNHLAGGSTALMRQHATSLALEAWCYGIGMNGTAKDWQSEIMLWNWNSSLWDSQGYAGMQFGRASAAYRLRDGAQVANNVPRFELGYFHNLLTANQSDGGEDGTTTGFTAVNAASISSVTEDKYQGTRSIKVVCPGSVVGEGVYAGGVACSLNETRSSRIRIKGPAGKVLRIELTRPLWYTYGQSDITCDGTWQEVTITNVILDDGPPNNALALKVSTAGAVPYAGSFYIDSLSINKGSYASGWVLGGTGRAFLPEEGTSNLLPLADQKFAGAWAGYYDAVITLTQNQVVPEWGATDATRIQSAGGTAAQKFRYAMTGTNGQVYAMSMWIKNNGTTAVALTNGNGTPTSQGIQPGQSVRAVITGVGDGASHAFFLLSTANVADAMDIIAWRPQVEAKAYATSFTDGTRAAESLTLPEPVRNGVLNEAEGEIWIYAKEDGISRDTFLWSTSMVATSYFYFKKTASGTYIVCFNNAGQLTKGSLLTVGFHLFKVVWKGPYVALFADGVKIADKTMTSPVCFSGATMSSIGSSINNTSQWNSLVDSILIKNKTQADAAAIEAAAAAEYVTYSQQPFAADANTTYINTFEDTLGAIMPFKKTITNPANYITEDTDGQQRAHMLIKSRYPSDGVEQAAVYVDYVRMGSKIAYASNPKLTRVTKNLAIDGNFAVGGSWGAADATKRKYGLTPLGLGYYMREGCNTNVYQTVNLIPGQQYSFGVWCRKGVGVGNGTLPLVSIVHLNYSGGTITSNATFALDSGNWQWVTKTFTVSPGTRAVNIVLLTSAGSNDIIQNASDFVGFILIPGSTPPSPVASPLQFPARKTSALQVTTALGSGDFVYAASNIDYRGVTKNGTRINSSASTQFLVEGMQLKPGVNTFQLESAVSSGLWKATMRYSPRYD